MGNKIYKDSTLLGFTKAQLIGIIRCLEHNIEVVEERNSNQFRLLMENEKYRWHELRKAPNDLPKPEDDSVMFECVLENHIHDAHYPAFYFNEELREFGYYNSAYAVRNGADEFETIEDMGYEKVIAWREIKYYEGAEE